MILAIDDDPDRYTHLARLVDSEIKVVACSECIHQWLPGAHAILLDHDLNSGYCKECGNKSDLVNTRSIVPQIEVPTIITSASFWTNRKWLSENLSVPRTLISALSIDPELTWIGWLYTQGIHP